VVIVETVGVGQSETAVSSMVDFFLVLMLAGAGDELQGIKKGIMELADAIAINKADGDNVDHAAKAKNDYENALHYLAPSSPLWRPVVHTISSVDNLGIGELWETILKHRTILQEAGEIDLKRKRQAVDWMHDMVEEELKREFYERAIVKGLLSELTHAVENGTISPGSAAKRLISI
jgi:LAO/AO transport system kinase